jgi:lantibiotic leader peptide-processing serine protease
MKKWMSGFALAGLLALSGQAVSAEEPKEYIVVFSSNSINEQSLTQLEESGAEVLQEVPQAGVVSVQSSDPEFIEKAKQDSNIQEVVEDIEISPLEVQMEVDLRAAASPALYSGADLHDKYQWDIKRVTNNGKAWEKNAGSHDVLVAVIDSGVDAFHPDLKENFLYGKAFFNGATEADALRDAGTHGTHVAGSIAANGRVLGVGPELGIASYRVSDHNGRMSWTAILNAVTTAADDGADVANLSLGTYSTMNDAQDRALHLSASRAVRHAQSKGMIIVGANGNDGIDLGKKMLTKPGEGAQWAGPLFDTFTDIPWVISVSSSTNRDTLAYYSNYGNSELAAPGGD